MVDTRASYWIFSPLANIATLASLSRLTTVYSSPYFWKQARAKHQLIAECASMISKITHMRGPCSKYDRQALMNQIRLPDKQLHAEGMLFL